IATSLKRSRHQSEANARSTQWIFHASSSLAVPILMNTQSPQTSTRWDSCGTAEVIGRVAILNIETFRNLGGVEANDSACRQVLIADDDPMFRRILQVRLQAWGYEVFAVENG